MPGGVITSYSIHYTKLYDIETLDPAAEGMPVVRERRDNVTLDCVLSNSFGFGGTNAGLVFRRYAG